MLPAGTSRGYSHWLLIQIYKPLPWKDWVQSAIKSSWLFPHECKMLHSLPQTIQGHLWEESQPATLIFAVSKKWCYFHSADITPHWPQKKFRFSTCQANLWARSSQAPVTCPMSHWSLNNSRKRIQRSLWTVGSRTCPVWEDFSFTCGFHS